MNGTRSSHEKMMGFVSVSMQSGASDPTVKLSFGLVNWMRPVLCSCTIIGSNGNKMSAESGTDGGRNVSRPSVFCLEDARVTCTALDTVYITKCPCYNLMASLHLTKKRKKYSNSIFFYNGKIQT